MSENTRNNYQQAKEALQGAFAEAMYLDEAAGEQAMLTASQDVLSAFRVHMLDIAKTNKEPPSFMSRQNNLKNMLVPKNPKEEDKPEVQNFPKFLTHTNQMSQI